MSDGFVTRPVSAPWLRGWQEAAAAAAACLAVAVATLLIAWAHGALGASRNDDWVYYRSAFWFFEHGIFEPNTSSSMAIGQVLLAQPIIAVFGQHILPLQIIVALASGLGLWASYLLIRTFLTAGWAAFSIGCLALGPIFGSLSTSFMTDSPAFTLQALTLVAGFVALGSNRLRTGWFALSLTFAFIAFSIREYSVAAVLAVVLAAAVRFRGKDLLRTSLLASTWLLGCLALYAWRRSVPGSGSVGMLAPSAAQVLQLSCLLFTLAFLVVAVLPLVSPRKAFKQATIIPAVLTVVVVWFLWLHLMRSRPGIGPLLGNYLTWTVSYAETVPGTPPLIFPLPLWELIQLLSGIGLVVLALLVFTNLRPTVRWIYRNPGGRSETGFTIAAFYIFSSVAVLGATRALLNAPLFDRGMIVLVPFVVAVVLRLLLDSGAMVNRSGWIATASLVVFGVFGLSVVDDSATFDGAKWRLASSVEAMGYEARSIDGSYEWYGFHQPTPGGAPTWTPSDASTWWVSFFPQEPICATSRFAAPTSDAESDIIAELSARSLSGTEFKLSAYRGPDACQVP